MMDLTILNGANVETSLEAKAGKSVLIGKSINHFRDVVRNLPQTQHRADSAFRTIGYSGAFSTDAAAYLSVYGWFFDPKTEYYIVESYGTRAPGSSAQTYEGGPYTTFDHKGSVYSDGDTYDIYLAVRHNIRKC